MDNVEELEKNWGKPARLCIDRLIATMGEPVSIRQPLLLDEHTKPFKRTVVRIEKDLSDGYDLKPHKVKSNLICNMPCRRTTFNL